MFQVTTSKGSTYPQTTETGGRSAGGGTYHLPHTPTRDLHSSSSSTSISPSPQTLVANLLSPRIRAISIPRPGLSRAQDLPGPYIHKSVAQAKENLQKSLGEIQVKITLTTM